MPTRNSLKAAVLKNSPGRAADSAKLPSKNELWHDEDMQIAAVARRVAGDLCTRGFPRERVVAAVRHSLSGILHGPVKGYLSYGLVPASKTARMWCSVKTDDVRRNLTAAAIEILEGEPAQREKPATHPNTKTRF